MSGLGPSIRPRRLRQSAAMRRLVGETDLRPRHLVLPLFVCPGEGVEQELYFNARFFSTP